MPAKYVAIRDKLKAEGKSDAAAKTSAAKIFNSQRKKGEAPVTGPEHPKAKRVGIKQSKKS